MKNYNSFENTKRVIGITYNTENMQINFFLPGIKYYYSTSSEICIIFYKSTPVFFLVPLNAARDDTSRYAYI